MLWNKEYYRACEANFGCGVWDSAAVMECHNVIYWKCYNSQEIFCLPVLSDEHFFASQ